MPEPGRKGYGKIEKSAMDALLETAWIHGLAAEWGISIARGEVKRELGRIKEESFKNGAEYRRFVKESRYTLRDLNERVELQVLSVRLQERLQTQIERAARNEFEEQRAFRKFLTEFNETWRARTVCAPQYATERCSNGPLPTDQD